VISQFLLRDVPYGAQWIGARIRTTLPTSEFMTEHEEWLAIQNGAAPQRQLQFDPTPRYIATGRDLAEYIHTGPALGWAAALLLATPGGGADPRYAGMYPPAQAVSYPSNPYRRSRNQAPAGATFGLPYVQALLAEGISYVTRASYWQKYFVHRTVRPEARPSRGQSCARQINPYGGSRCRGTAAPSTKENQNRIRCRARNLLSGSELASTAAARSGRSGG